MALTKYLSAFLVLLVSGVGVYLALTVGSALFAAVVAATGQTPPRNLEYALYALSMAGLAAVIGSAAAVVMHKRER